MVRPLTSITRSWTWKPAASGGGARLDLGDPRRHDADAETGEQQGEDGDGQNEIGHRPGRDDQRPLPDRFEIEIVALGPGPVFGDDFLAQRLNSGLVGHGGTIQVAGEFHIATQGQPGQPPLDPVAIRPAEQGPAKADREAVDLHLEGARDEEMAQLVNGDDNGQHQQERDHIDEHLSEQVQHYDRLSRCRVRSPIVRPPWRVCR